VKKRDPFFTRMKRSIHYKIVLWTNNFLTISDAIARLRGNDRFLMERIVERDETIRKLVAQVNYLTTRTDVWAREYMVLRKIELQHLKDAQKRRERAQAKAAIQARLANKLPNEPMPPLSEAEKIGLRLPSDEDDDATQE
jgi:hypothetical protein